MKPLKLWGGLECTLNRVGDRYVDQCEKNGHYERLSDLKLFHDLGIDNLRYPCLWEKVAPKDLDHCDWSYLDERLGELKKLNQKFIAGFLHHGSGPRYTSLIDPDFPEKLATYARLFATRYPWVSDFTPINEINTTARFSLLYGHWYPHLKEEYLYYKSVLLQCKATVLAMKEIRAINPSACLIQTDDIGKCQGTGLLQYQVDFENERRWFAWDLLFGKIDKSNVFFQRVLDVGIKESELDWFIQNPCPPDVIGLNHYHLSNRYLDERVDLFPVWSHGGNGKHIYADVGAIDTGFSEPEDIEGIIRDCWERYHSRIAITECHARGRREAQMRWLYHVWNQCKKLKSEGIDIEAVTVWSLLGTYDWHNLCTKCEKFYEPGVFDLRNPERLPHETGLSRLVRTLTHKGDSDEQVLKSEGVWKTPRRILFNAQAGSFSSLEHPEGTRPVIITGGTGTLGQAFARVCGERNIHYILTRRSELDITSSDSIINMIEKYNPWAVINAAGYVRVDDAEMEKEKCFQENAEAARLLATLCGEKHISFVTFSSDLVFGEKEEFVFRESSPVAPINVYGESKAVSERQVLESNPDALIIRTSSFFGPWDAHNFITKTLRSVSQNSEVKAPRDMFISPTYVPDLANEALDLLIDGERGIIHLTNVGDVSWEEFAQLALKTATGKLNLDSQLVKGVVSDELGFKAKRPKRSVLVSERFRRLPPLEDAMKRYFRELQIPLEQEIRE